LKRPSSGILALSAFFLFGAVMSGISWISLLAPGSPLDSMWRVNPEGHAGLTELGGWAVVLMLAVCIGCGLAAIGLWRGAWWGHRLAIGLLVVNLIGDLVSARLHGDPRTLIGVPIAVAMITYLMSRGVREHFRIEAE
jgi:hypothetical protein